MKKFNVFFALAFLCAGLMVSAQEQAPAIEGQDDVVKPGVALTLAWDSKYVSKGKILNEDPVASFDACIDYYGFYLDVWGQYDMTSRNDGSIRSSGRIRNDWYRNNRRYRAEEIDYRLGYAKSFDTDISPISLDAYWVYFQYPQTVHTADGKETECGISLTLDNLLDKEGKAALALGTELSYSLYNEHENGEDSYFFGKVFADYSVALCEKATAGVKTTIYWRSHKARRAAYRGYDEDGRYHKASGFAIPNVEVQPYVKYAFNDYISAKAYVAGTWAVEQTTRAVWKKRWEHQHDAAYWCGVSVSAAW